ncbi:MAG: glycerophosphodiester phosphodiesterase family protein, partial [Ornithinimicrobium sp.]
TLDRVSDAMGSIEESSWTRVSRALIKGREPIPRLDELLDTWPDLRVNIDVKADSAVTATVAAIERARAHDRVLISSFSDRRRRDVVTRLSAPVASSAGRRVGAGFVTGGVLPGRMSDRAVSRVLRDVDALQVPLAQYRVPIVTAASVQAAHRAGRVVHVWTINDAPTMHRLLDLGVDGLVTDRADVLKDVLIERGQWA